jgi:hypothetical protein
VRLEPSTHFPIIGASTFLNPETLIFEQCTNGCHECYFDEDNTEHCSACPGDMWLGFIQIEGKQVARCLCPGLDDFRNEDGECISNRDDVWTIPQGLRRRRVL